MPLYEAKIVFQGFAWNINSFDQEGVQLGKVLATEFLDCMTGKAARENSLDSKLLKIVCERGLMLQSIMSEWLFIPGIISGLFFVDKRDLQRYSQPLNEWSKVVVFPVISKVVTAQEAGRADDYGKLSGCYLPGNENC